MTDSHCHIAGEEFVADLAGRRGARAAAGVSRALVILAAEDDAEIARAAAVLRAWPECRFAVGVHPHHANVFAVEPGRPLRRRWPSASTRCPRRARSARLASTTTTTSRRATCSTRCFARSSGWRSSRDLPIVIHTREAEDDTLRIITEEGAGPPARRVPLLHRRPGRRRRARSPPASASRFPASRPFRRPTRCARRRPARRRIGCSSKPTARTSRRCRFAASATSRRTSRRWSNSSRRRAASSAAAIGEQTDRNFDRLFRP